MDAEIQARAIIREPPGCPRVLLCWAVTGVPQGPLPQLGCRLLTARAPSLPSIEALGPGRGPSLM